MPFKFKMKVFKAVIMSSLLHGSESWLTEQMKEVEKMYVSSIKALLGVRETTRTDTVLLEIGMPPVKHLVQKMGKSFAKKNLVSSEFNKTPLHKIYKMCEEKQTNVYKFIKKLLDTPDDGGIEILKQKFTRERGTKAATYKQINLLLKVNQVYEKDIYIDERKRIMFTRFRLSSHDMKIEGGKWARIDRENRLCDCDEIIQDEYHVLFNCIKTDDIRSKYSVN